MHEHRVLVLENKARADIARVYTRESVLRDVMEHKCLDVLELAGYVRKLEGRLQAVCDVLSDADAFDGVISDDLVMRAVRGE